MGTSRKAIIIGISGPSSSGKTTLARLLRDVFPRTFILHQDDFYRAEEEIPSKDGLLDWDCAEALNYDDMARALEHIRAEGTFPPPTPPSKSPFDKNVPNPKKDEEESKKKTLNRRSRLTAPPPLHPQPFVDSKEDQNSVGKCTVSDSAIEAAKARVAAWLQPGQPGHGLFTSPSPPPSTSSTSIKTTGGATAATVDGTSNNKALNICILDGFLLFGREPPLKRLTDELLDIKLFLTVSRETAVTRRGARDGYVTLEGFWTDPPGYVEKIVWPNYAESHAWLFVDGNVEGRLDGAVLAEKGILALPSVIDTASESSGGGKTQGVDGEGGLDVDMAVMFEWAVETLMQKLEEIARTFK